MLNGSSLKLESANLCYPINSRELHIKMSATVIWPLSQWRTYFTKYIIREY